MVSVVFIPLQVCPDPFHPNLEEFVISSITSLPFKVCTQIFHLVSLQRIVALCDEIKIYFDKMKIEYKTIACSLNLDHTLKKQIKKQTKETVFILNISHDLNN